MMENQTMRRFQLLWNKKSKSTECYEEEEDRISELPDQILVRLVSFLPLKEALATSMLSRRWPNVWTSTWNLNFDGQEALTNMIMTNNYHNPNVYYDKELKSQRSKFITSVNNVINQHVPNITLKQFRISFDLDNSSTYSINSWIEFAMKKRVEILELEFLQMGGTTSYILRREFFASVGLKTLKVLHLASIRVSGQDIDYLLSKCSALERLKVSDSIRLVTLRVSGPSLSLKFLEIYFCREIKRIEILDAQKLVSFYLDCSEKPPLELLISNVPRLADVRIRLREFDYVPRAFTMLLCCISQLQILQLDVVNAQCGFERDMKNRVYPMLKNLRQLNLILNQYDRYNLVKIIPFIKASAYLEKLVLKLCTTRIGNGKSQLRKVPKVQHYYLKELEILGYSGVTSDELINYFINNAFSLKKIIVNPMEYKEYPSMQPRPIGTRKKEEMARNHAMNIMKKKVSPNIDFICL